MKRFSQVRISFPFAAAFQSKWTRPTITLALLLIAPALASAQSPFDTGFTALQTLFNGTIAKVASLVAIVVGGYSCVLREPCRSIWICQRMRAGNNLSAIVAMFATDYERTIHTVAQLIWAGIPSEPLGNAVRRANVDFESALLRFEKYAGNTVMCQLSTDWIDAETICRQILGPSVA